MMIERLKLPLGRLKRPSNNHSKAVITFVLIKVVVLDFFWKFAEIAKKLSLLQQKSIAK